MVAEILFQKKEDCCGCGACASACPADAIVLQEDADGFWYPVVNEGKCVHCGRCHQVCSFQHGNRTPSQRKTFAAALNSKNILQSSSGGVFFGLAEQFLAQGGTVYGCSLKRSENGFSAEHVRVTVAQELKLLQGSKYVQSNTSGMFSYVEADLKAGIPVLFSGTPCQVFIPAQLFPSLPL